MTNTRLSNVAFIELSIVYLFSDLFATVDEKSMFVNFAPQYSLLARVHRYII